MLKSIRFMTNFIKTIQLTHLKKNTMAKFNLADLNIALYNIEGKIFATSNTCTHEECSLSDGFLSGKIVECPCHGGRFDITTGKVMALPPTLPIKTYNVRIINNDIEVEI